MKRGIIFSVIIVVVLAIGAIFLFGIGSKSPKVTQVDLHSLSTTDAITKLSTVEGNVSSYDLVSHLRYKMKIPIFVLMSMDVNLTFTAEVNRKNKELNGEGLMYSNISFQSLKNFDNSEFGFDNTDKSYVNESRIIITIKDNKMTTNNDGNITEETLTDDVWKKQDQMLYMSDILKNSSFDFLPDEQIDGIDYYALRLNVTSKKAFGLLNRGGDTSINTSKLEQNAIPVDLRLWVEKKSLLIERMALVMNMTNKDGQGFYAAMDYAISNVKFM
jgi:hypothetical protein